MNNTEAAAIVREWLDRLRREPYGTLAAQVGQPPVTKEVSRNGVAYQVQVLHVWDSVPDANVRVMIAVDDRGLRAFVPLTDDFIKTPDGQFVGE